MDPFEMCSEEEAQRRESSRTLSVFEKRRDSEQLDPRRVVKEYSRSSQLQAIRSPQALTRTVDYLLSHIVEYDRGCPQYSFLDVFAFVSDRMRAVVKDYKLGGATKAISYVHDLERIARFHIVAAAEGAEFAAFDTVLNLQRLEDVLMALREAYAEADCEHEAEFTGYRLLLRIANVAAGLKCIAESKAEVRKNPMFAIALRAFANFHTGNYVALLKMIASAPLLLGILLSVQVQTHRSEFLSCMKQSYRGALPFPSFAQILSLSSADIEAFFGESARTRCLRAIPKSRRAVIESPA